jgi:hypothetical protein
MPSNKYPLRSILRTLEREQAVDEDFVIRYTLRNQFGKPGHGARGVSPGVIDLYGEELRWTLQYLSKIGLKSKKRQRNVYVFDLAEAKFLIPAPLVTIDPLGSGKDLSLAILLPSRTNLPTSELEQLYLRAATNHECTHIVCFEQKGLGGAVPENPGFGWFSEGTAEWVALKRARSESGCHIQTFEFIGDWSVCPHVPMVLEDTWYSSVVFIDYLERCNDARWIADMWRDATSKRDDDPWRKIQAKCGRDVFMQFCCDSYFINDRNGRFYCPDIFKRFGPRTLEHSYESGTNGWIKSEVLDFSCRYFAIRPARATKALTVEFKCTDPTVRAVLLASTHQYREAGERVHVEPPGRSVDLNQYNQAEHFVLTVSTEPLSSSGHFKTHPFDFRLS